MHLYDTKTTSHSALIQDEETQLSGDKLPHHSYLGLISSVRMALEPRPAHFTPPEEMVVQTYFSSSLLRGVSRHFLLVLYIFFILCIPFFLFVRSLFASVSFLLSSLFLCLLSWCSLSLPLIRTY